MPLRQRDGGEGGYKDGSPPARQSPRTLRTTSSRDRAGGKGPEGGDGSRETAHLGYEPINKHDAAAQRPAWPASPKLRRGTKPPCSPPFLPCVSQPFREAKAAARGARGGGHRQRWQLVLSLAEGHRGQTGREPGRGSGPSHPSLGRGMLRGSELRCRSGLSTWHS